MYADCVASTSRLAFEDIWDPPVFERFFPVSDCRYDSRVPDTRPRDASTTPHLQAPSKLSANVLHPAATTSYSTTLPTRTQISPGIFTDGRNLVFSSAHPEVQGLLAAARSTLTLPKPSSEVIFALSALEVFYKPADPVHWLFWSDDKKFATADVVTRISRKWSAPLSHSAKPDWGNSNHFTAPSPQPPAYHFLRGMEWQARILGYSRDPPRNFMAPVL